MVGVRGEIKEIDKRVEKGEGTNIQIVDHLLSTVTRIHYAHGRYGSKALWETFKKIIMQAQLCEPRQVLYTNRVLSTEQIT